VTVPVLLREQPVIELVTVTAKLVLAVGVIVILDVFAPPGVHE
jgi:hypothetical protein